ncbi:MAG: helicase-related protein [Sulfurimonas sp.]|nr:helicase-related protein [Sulfurimonas sp.]
MSKENIQTTKKYYDNISVANRTQQLAYFVQQHDKNRMFEELLKTLGEKQILVLVKSKRSADGLMEYLQEKEISSIAIHGNHRAAQIEDANAAFNAKETAILITTSRILEALKLQDVGIVVYYDLPNEAADYSKALRLVDEVGKSIALIDPEDEGMLSTLELTLKCEITEVEMQGFEHTNHAGTAQKDKTKKPRHKKVLQKAKRKANIKSKWVPST